MHGKVDAEQRCKRLVDAHRADIVHGIGDGIACGGVGDEATTVHILLEGAEGSVAAYGEHALIGVTQGDCLEMIAEPRQARQSRITQRPVRQHAFQGREDVERRTAAGGVGREEGGDEHVSAILTDGAYLWIELRPADDRSVGIGHAGRIEGVGILSLYAGAEPVER